jgi:hypothetical protein
MSASSATRSAMICPAPSRAAWTVATPAGEVVWEYVSPYFGPSPRFGLSNFVFRAFRYSPAEIERARGR